MAAKQGYGPDLRKFLDKRLEIKLNGNRKISGVVKGYDTFMNFVIDEAHEHISASMQRDIGTIVIRGNSIIMWECIDKII